MPLTVEMLLEDGAIYAECVLQSASTGEEGDYETRQTGIETIHESYNDRDDAATTILVSDGADPESIIKQILAGLAHVKITWEDGDTCNKVAPADLLAHVQRFASGSPDCEWMGMDVCAKFLWYYYENSAFMPGHTRRELLDLRTDSVLDVSFEQANSGVRMTDQGLELKCAVRVAQRWVLEDRETDAPEGFCLSMQDVLGIHQDYYPVTLVIDMANGRVRDFALRD